MIMEHLIIPMLLTYGMSSLASGIQPVNTWAGGTIYIRADGNVDPETAPISSVDNITYTFTDNITGDASGIAVERDNIVVDGAGYSILGIFTTDSRGICLLGRSNVTIRNMEISGWSLGIVFESSSNSCISGSNVTDNAWIGVYISHSSNNTISRNTIRGNRDGSKLVSSSNRNSILGNDITENGDHGVWLQHSSNNIISENNITDNRAGIGAAVAMGPSSSDNVISANNITNNRRQGIYVEGSSNNNTLLGNEIALNDVAGIELMSSSIYNSIIGNKLANNSDGVRLYSSNNTVSGNNITNCRAAGIACEWSSNYNTVYRNNLLNNWQGVWLPTHNNRFYHNNFLNNTNQVSVPSSGYQRGPNSWDNGCEGNYWSDYGVIDNSTPCDGIGDAPYIIDENNQDNCPLMNPHWNPCDINHDLKVNIKDVATAAVAFGSSPNHPKWNPHADITGEEHFVPDGRIDIGDIATVALHFGEVDP